MPELKALLEVLADEGEPRGAGEVLHRARARAADLGSGAPTTRSRGPLLVAAAAVVAVLVTASSVILFRDGGEQESRPTSSGSGRQVGKWTEVSFPKSGFEPGTRVQAITRNAPGLVAVGSVSDATGLPVQAAWTSSDGRRWHRSPSAAFGAGSIDLVVKYGDGLIAVGSTSDPSSAGTVWRSDDGRQWERLTEQAPPGMRSLVAGGPGLVAAGFVLRDEDVATATRGAIWSSADGTRWSKVPNSKRLFPSGQVTGLTVDRSRLVAIGTDQRDTNSRVGRAAVWSSNDGTHWNRVEGRAGLRNAIVTGSGPVANRDGDLRALAAPPVAGPAPPPTTKTSAPPGDATTGTAIIGICARASGENAVWGSERGRRWNRISKRDAIPGASQLVDAGDWWLAGGMRGTCEATRSVVYISSNGRQWTKAKSDPRRSRSLSSVNAMSSTARGAVVVVGPLQPATGVESGPEVWLWTAPR